MLLGFAALAILPLEKITAIHFVVPLLVTILAVIFLKEYPSLDVIFGGTIIILGISIILIDPKIFFSKLRKY